MRLYNVAGHGDRSPGKSTCNDRTSIYAKVINKRCASESNKSRVEQENISSSGQQCSPNLTSIPSYWLLNPFIPLPPFSFSILPNFIVLSPRLSSAPTTPKATDPTHPSVFPCPDPAPPPAQTPAQPHRLATILPLHSQLHPPSPLLAPAPPRRAAPRSKREVSVSQPVQCKPCRVPNPGAASHNVRWETAAVARTYVLRRRIPRRRRGPYAHDVQTLPGCAGTGLWCWWR